MIYYYYYYYYYFGARQSDVRLKRELDLDMIQGTFLILVMISLHFIGPEIIGDTLQLKERL